MKEKAKQESPKKKVTGETGSQDKEEAIKKSLDEFKEDELGKETEEEKEEEPEAPMIELEDFIEFLAKFIAKGLPEELKQKFVKEYTDFVEPPLTLLKYNESIGWLFTYLAVMPDWQRFLIGSGLLVGVGLYMRVSFVKEMKKAQQKIKERAKEQKKSEKEEVS